MKLKSFFVLALTFCFFLPQETQAQSEEYPVNIGVDISASAAGFALNFIGNAIETIGTGTANISYTSTPGIQATVDYGINKWFSLGVAGYYQSFNGTIPDYNDGITTFDEAKISIQRYNVGLRPLFHYGNQPQLDMYSGLRLGYTGWEFASDELSEADLDAIRLSRAGFRVQLIAFGIRGYFNEWLGLGMEVALGSPHYLMGGVNIRF